MGKIKNMFDKAFAVDNDEEVAESQDTKRKPTNNFSNSSNNIKKTTAVKSMNTTTTTNDYNRVNQNTQKKTAVMKMPSNSGAKVHMFEPASINDATKAIEYLNNGYAVLVNLENSDKALSQRIVDVITGALYLLDGDYSIVTEDIYLFAPKGVEISSPLEAENAKDEKVEKNANNSSFKFRK